MKKHTPKPVVELKPLKTLQETMDEYIKNDEMRALIMSILVHLKKYNLGSANIPCVTNRKNNSMMVDISNGAGGRANVELYKDTFIVAYDIPGIQFANPDYYKVEETELVASLIAKLIAGVQ